MGYVIVIVVIFTCAAYVNHIYILKKIQNNKGISVNVAIGCICLAIIMLHLVGCLGNFGR